MAEFLADQAGAETGLADIGVPLISKWNSLASYTGCLPWLWKRCLAEVALLLHNEGGPGT